MKTYAELYDEIVQGYEGGTREMYVAGKDGPRKLTKEEELDALDAAYKKTVDSFVTMEQTNQRARTIIGEEAEKIAKISRRETKAADFLKEQKARGLIRFLRTLPRRCSVRLLRLRRTTQRSILMWVHYRSCWQVLRFHSKGHIPQRA